MKKLIILLIAIIFCISCRTETVTTDSTSGIFPYIWHFEYKGHQYIYFSGVSKGGVVHDPDCQCNKKEQSWDF